MARNKKMTKAEKQKKELAEIKKNSMASISKDSKELASNQISNLDRYAGNEDSLPDIKKSIKEVEKKGHTLFVSVAGIFNGKQFERHKSGKGQAKDSQMQEKKRAEEERRINELNGFNPNPMAYGNDKFSYITGEFKLQNEKDYRFLTKNCKKELASMHDINNEDDFKNAVLEGKKIGLEFDSTLIRGQFVDRERDMAAKDATIDANKDIRNKVEQIKKAAAEAVKNRVETLNENGQHSSAELAKSYKELEENADKMPGQAEENIQSVKEEQGKRFVKVIFDGYCKFFDFTCVSGLSTLDVVAVPNSSLKTYLAMHPDYNPIGFEDKMNHTFMPLSKFLSFADSKVLEKYLKDFIFFGKEVSKKTMKDAKEKVEKYLKALLLSEIDNNDDRDKMTVKLNKDSKKEIPMSELPNDLQIIVKSFAETLESDS